MKCKFWSPPMSLDYLQPICYKFLVHTQHQACGEFLIGIYCIHVNWATSNKNVWILSTVNGLLMIMHALKSSCEYVLTHGFNTPITMQQSWATYMCACWKIIIEIYIRVQGSKISMVDFIFTRNLATHNQIQLIFKKNSIYNNGNKLTITLKTSNSKPNSKNKFVNKNRHVAIPLFGHLLNGYGQAWDSMEHGLLVWSSMLSTFYTLYVLTQKKNYNIGRFQKLVEKIQ